MSIITISAYNGGNGMSEILVSDAVTSLELLMNNYFEWSSSHYTSTGYTIKSSS